MKEYLKNLTRDIRDLVCLTGKIASQRDVNAYLVGGIVRDLILGVPNFDLDIVIQGDGLKFAFELARCLDARLVTHPRFGTATLITPKKIKLDIATCRSEVYPEPASLPVVSPGTIEEDLARRDFTINALAIDILPESFGKLVDFYQGRKDLKAKSIRILHDLSFVDDPTRIIRAVRFEQRLKFRIEPRSLKLLKAAAKKGMLKRVSPHRLRDEIILILSEPVAVRCILRLKRIIGLDFIHQQLELNQIHLKYLKAINKEIDWFNKNFHQRRSLDTWLMYFIGLLSPLNTRQISQVCKKFSLRRGEIKRIISYKRFSAQNILFMSKKNISPSKIHKTLQPLSFETILLIKAKYRNKFLDLHINNFLKHYNDTRIYISGKDLTQFGLKPNPDYKKILARLFSLQLDGQINSRQDALEWIAAKYKDATQNKKD